MAANRKKQTASVRFGPAVLAALLCLALGAAGLGYVWQKQQNFKLGQQKKERELKLDALKQECKQRLANLAKLRSHRSLEERVKKLNVGLVPKDPSQVVHLPEPLASGTIQN